MAETVLLVYPAVYKDTVMVTSMKADFFEKKVGVPGGALDIPVCTKAESQAIFDDNKLSQQKQIIAKKVNSFIIRAFLQYNKKIHKHPKPYFLGCLLFMEESKGWQNIFVVYVKRKLD